MSAAERVGLAQANRFRYGHAGVGGRPPRRMRREPGALWRRRQRWAHVFGPVRNRPRFCEHDALQTETRTRTDDPRPMLGYQHRAIRDAHKRALHEARDSRSTTRR